MIGWEMLDVGWQDGKVGLSLNFLVLSFDLNPSDHALQPYKTLVSAAWTMQPLAERCLLEVVSSQQHLFRCFACENSDSIDESRLRLSPRDECIDSSVVGVRANPGPATPKFEGALAAIGAVRNGRRREAGRLWVDWEKVGACLAHDCPSGTDRITVVCPSGTDRPTRE